MKERVKAWALFLWQERMYLFFAFTNCFTHDCAMARTPFMGWKGDPECVYQTIVYPDLALISCLLSPLQANLVWLLHPQRFLRHKGQVSIHYIKVAF